MKKEEAQKRIYKELKKHGRVKCVICGEEIRQYDIEDGSFEYISNKRGELYIHSRCKERKNGFKTS